MRWTPALVLLFAGCLGAPAEEWVLGGAFTAERTQADVDALCDVARAHGVDCLLMESYPEQFSFRFRTEGACEDARADAAAVPHVVVRACVRVTPTADPDAPASATAEGARRGARASALAQAPS